MNFELVNRLTKLLTAKNLEAAIQLAESELEQIPTTDFHIILGKKITSQSQNLKVFIEAFSHKTTKLLNSKGGLLKRILGSRNQKIPKAFYCEMNGFTINYDRWYLDLFSFEKTEDNNWEWLCDFYDSADKGLTIVGLEDLQKVFEDVHENNRFNEPNINKAYEICELLIILRLQELFSVTYKNENSDWSKIPMYITAHDYEMIYKVN